MKNKAFKIFSLAACSIFLFSCATGNKYSKKSYGGGWNETVATTEKQETVIPNDPVNNVVQSEPVQEVTTTATPEVTPIAEVSKMQNTGKVDNSVKASTKVSTGQKIAQKMLAKKVAKISKKQNPNEVDNKILLVILAILLPWLAVLLYKGVGTQFWISLLLWFLFVLPGIIYALLVVLDVI